jgi:hypothetical protein
MKEKRVLKLIRQETLECGFKKCCPTVKLFEDGSIELSDDDAEAGSVGTIKLRPEAAARLVELAAAKR